MAGFTRGFKGRGKNRDPRLPPGPVRHRQALADAHRGGDAEARHRGRGRSTSTGLVERPTTWTWDEIHALPASTYSGAIHCVTTWSKFDMVFAGVSVDALLEVAGPLPDRDPRPRRLPHRLHDEPAARGRDRRQGVGRVGGRRRAAPAPARRPGAAARPAPLLLEERQVGLGAPAPRPQRARLLGAQRLPRPRRPVARAALPGRLTVSDPVTADPSSSSRRSRADPLADGEGRRRSATRRRPRRRSASRCPTRRRTGRASTSSCGSPRPTATRRRARTPSASPPDDTNEIELTVERLQDGEISTFLHDEVVVGDELEVRGPIGGWFVWDGDTPATLIGGGSGVVPLMAMLRLARNTGRSDLVRLIVSARTPTTSTTRPSCPGRRRTIVYTRATPPGFAASAGPAHHRRFAPVLAARRDRVRLRLAAVRRRRDRPAHRPRLPGRAHPGRTLRRDRIARCVRSCRAPDSRVPGLVEPALSGDGIGRAEDPARGFSIVMDRTQPGEVPPARSGRPSRDRSRNDRARGSSRPEHPSIEHSRPDTIIAVRSSAGTCRPR